MELIALSCQMCGAPLEVPIEVKHVSCVHCGAALVVKRQGSVLFTEKIEALQQRTESIQSQLDEYRISQALERLDEQWEGERRELSVAWAEEYVIVPTPALGCFLGLLIMAAAFPIGYISALPIGVGIALWGFFVGIRICFKAEEYENALKAYVDRRAEIRRGKFI